MTEGGVQRVLETERLRLRQLRPDDAAVIQRLAGAREIADTTLTVPHPYAASDAETFIEKITEAWREGRACTCAIERRADDAFVGIVGLAIDREHERAELGYWIGVPYWTQGYATEASRRLVAFGFDELGLNRIQAHHLSRNPASGRVLEKIGMQHEGRIREYIIKWGVCEDAEAFSILRSDYEAHDRDER